MNFNKIKIFTVYDYLFVSIIWLLIFLSPLMVVTKDYNWNHIRSVWISMIPFFTIFVLNRSISIPLLFFKRRYKSFVILSILLIGTGTIYVQNFGVQPHNRERLDREHHSFREGRAPKRAPRPAQLPKSLNFIILSFLIIGFDTGLKSSFRWVESEQKRVEKDKESVETQLLFLKNQVSPHFFMNTLNNIHSLIDIDGDQAKESVIQLSKLMRHLLYDSDTKLISIKKEFEFIRNYVDLMRLRFSDKVKISLEIPDIVEDLKIPPLLFTSFVENSFKHGVTYKQESLIDINIQLSDKSLLFSCVNSKPIEDSVSNGSINGIGVKNSKQRLNLIYGDNYKLNIDNQDDRYEVKLEVPV